MLARSSASQTTQLVLADVDVLMYCARFLDCRGLGLLCSTCRGIRTAERTLGVDMWLEFAEHTNAVFLMQALRRAVCFHSDGHAWLLFAFLHARCVHMTGSEAFFLGLLRYPLDEPRPLLASAVLSKNYMWMNAFAALMNEAHAGATELCVRECVVQVAASFTVDSCGTKLQFSWGPPVCCTSPFATGV